MSCMFLYTSQEVCEYRNLQTKRYTVPCPCRKATSPGKPIPSRNRTEPTKQAAPAHVNTTAVNSTLLYWLAEPLTEHVLTVSLFF